MRQQPSTLTLLAAAYCNATQSNHPSALYAMKVMHNAWKRAQEGEFDDLDAPLDVAAFVASDKYNPLEI